MLAPDAKVDQRRREFPGITVEPIKFASSELGAESWKFLLGAYGNDSLYIRQLVAIMRRHRSGLTVDAFRQEIASAGLPAATQRLADDRLNLAEPYIDDTKRLGDLLRPGRTVIVDLRDEWIEKDEALGLFVVMLRIFAATKFSGRDFNKLVVFDEAHKYITESDLIGQVVETIREMRHQATSVVIASQDPLSVPRAVIELTSILLLHRMTSPQWLKHLKSALVALEDVEEGHLAALALAKRLCGLNEAPRSGSRNGHRSCMCDRALRSMAEERRRPCRERRFGSRPRKRHADRSPTTQPRNVPFSSAVARVQHDVLELGILDVHGSARA